MENRLLFVDLDHTLIRPITGQHNNKIFPKDINDWEFIPETLNMVENFVVFGNYTLVIVTNQGGIELGYLTEQDFITKVEDIKSKLPHSIQRNITFKYCISMKGFDRKPNPGMAYKAAIEFEVSLRSCIMVGDMDSDEAFALNSGIETYYDVKEFQRLENVLNNKNVQQTNQKTL